MTTNQQLSKQQQLAREEFEASFLPSDEEQEYQSYPYNVPIIVHKAIKELLDNIVAEAFEAGREEELGNVYNRLVKLSDETYGVLQMVDVARLLLIDMQKELKSNNSHKGEEKV